MTSDVIIPIYNESRTLKAVIEALLQSNLFDKIICVNDGSTDNSLEILESFGNKIELITYKENKGKGHAMAEGIKRSTSEIILFTDADFLGLSEEHLAPILKPLQEKRCDGVIGNFYNSMFIKFFPNLEGSVSGQRAYFRKDLQPLVEDMKNTRFGVEVFINKAFKNKKVEMIIIRNSPKHFFKPQKLKLHVAVMDYLRAGYDIGKEMLRMRAHKSKR